MLTILSRTAALVGALAVAVTTTLTATPGPAAAADPVVLQPPRLERGADVRGVHLEGSTIVDGERRIPVRGRAVTLLGAAGRGYVVLTLAPGAEAFTARRVARSGATRVLARGTYPGEAVLSGTGEHLALERDRTTRRTTVEVVTATRGKPVGERTFLGSREILDLHAGRLVLGGPGGPGTQVWDVRSGDARVVDRRPAYAADLTGNRIAVYNADPYAGGCTVVRTLDTADLRLWRSCRERVVAFSPEGRRMATVDLLADGLGPEQVWNRRSDGGALAATYGAGYFGAIGWESESALLMEVYGRRKAADVRCVAAACERTGALRPSPEI